MSGFENYDYDVIVDDVHAKAVAELGNNLAGELDTIYNRYRKLLARVVEEAVISGTTHDALAAFLTSVEELQGLFERTGSCYRTAVLDGLREIDDADKYLY